MIEVEEGLVDDVPVADALAFENDWGVVLVEAELVGAPTLTLPGRKHGRDETHVEDRIEVLLDECMHLLFVARWGRSKLLRTLVEYAKKSHWPGDRVSATDDRRVQLHQCGGLRQLAAGRGNPLSQNQQLQTCR